MRVVIIGAGVAGCVMARQLSLLDGMEVRCLERVTHDDHSGAGTGLNVGPNAVKALQAIDRNLVSAISRASYAWRRWRISLTDGTVLFDLPLDEVADDPGWRIRWSDLYRVLRDAAGSLVRYGCDIVAIERDNASSRKTSVTWTEAGRLHRLDDIDLLIAGDGRYSFTRRALTGEPDVTQTGIAISRVLVPKPSQDLIDDYEQWFNGPNRMLAFRVPPGHVYIASAFPISRDADIPPHLKQSDALRAAFLPAQAAPSAQARWLIDTICDNVDITHWARMQEHTLLYRAPDCNVLYLGDAAHGMVPTLGQGATQALEDAACASALISRRYAAGDCDIESWLAQIETLRTERMRFVMEFSLAASDTMMAGADPVQGTLRKNEPPFRNRLKALYRNVEMPQS